MFGPLAQEFIDSLTPEEKAMAEERYQEIRTRQLSLLDVRKAHDLTQERMAEMLGVRQENISRLEKRSDMLLSTLRSYIQAMGGDLKLIVEFPGKPPIALTGFSDLH